MPTTDQLTDTKIKNAKPGSKPYKIKDANGLYIEIRPNGNKFWRYRYRIAGKENVFAIGEFRKNKSDSGHVGLADARTRRDEARVLVKKGMHPAHHRKSLKDEQLEANENTFKSLALRWYEERQGKKQWSVRYADQIKKTFEGDVFPVIGSLPVRYVTPTHIEKILERIEERGAETVAILTRQWCSAVFLYAIRKRKAETDPAAAFKGTIERPKVVHSRPLPLDEIPVFLEKLSKYQGRMETVIAIRLLMLTMVRTKELREATWDEFDLDQAIWRIPAHRMKMQLAHLVPLSRQAVELLRELNALTGHRGWLLPNSRSPQKPMTATTLNRAIEYMGYKGRFSCHGFRSTASTLLNEQGYRSDVVERALAHTEGNKSRKPYNQAEYLQERREMLQEWADFLGAVESGGKVIPLRRNARGE